MNRRFRIAMVAACPFPAPRGTPIRIFRLADELVRRGHDVDVFAYHLGSNDWDAAFTLYRIPNIRTYRKHSPGPSCQKLAILDPLLAVKLVRALRRRRYDVLHAHHAEGLLAALPAHLLLRVPLVFDAHTLLESELPYYRLGVSRGFLRRIGRSLDARLPRYADHVIAVSEEIRDALTRQWGYPDESISVIPNGVEAEFCNVAEKRLPSAADGPTIVYAGNLAAYQRIDLLLRGFAAALAKRADLWLQIYAPGDFAEFEPLAAELGIRARIRIDDVSAEKLAEKLAAADVAVNPRTECAGLPQKLLNYMATGCPIVSFAGSAKHVTHLQSGWVVPNGDVEALGDGMLGLVANRSLAGKLGAAASRVAREELGWARAAERVEAVYELVASTQAEPSVA